MMLMVALVLTACNHHTIYSHYEPTHFEGWNRNDTLCFEVTSIGDGGRYAGDIGVRTSSLYPFMAVTLIVEQRTRPSELERNDTLELQLTSEDGDILGQGINHYQYFLPLPLLTVPQGDTLQVRVRHHMRREVLQGITDVGITIRRE
jgi:gliding motility-associated lipoprotein GldH